MWQVILRRKTFLNNRIMNTEPTPPPCNADSDGTSDVQLLQAISAHPAAAAALAAIASGTPPREALTAFLADDAEPLAPGASLPVSSPAFLGGIQPDFWDEAFGF